MSTENFQSTGTLNPYFTGLTRFCKVSDSSDDG